MCGQAFHLGRASDFACAFWPRYFVLPPLPVSRIAGLRIEAMDCELGAQLHQVDTYGFDVELIAFEKGFNNYLSYGPGSSFGLLEGSILGVHVDSIVHGLPYFSSSSSGSGMRRCVGTS